MASRARSNKRIRPKRRKKAPKREELSVVLAQLEWEWSRGGGSWWCGAYLPPLQKATPISV
jgi:hypothetical protein